MALKLQMPELLCMEVDNYKKYFRGLCWGGTRKSEKKTQKRLVNKKDKLRKIKRPLVSSFVPMLLGNPSQFAVYAIARRSVLAGWKSLPGLNNDQSDDSDSDDQLSQNSVARIPKITGIGLQALFSLIYETRFTDTIFVEKAMIALRNVLQGHAPEELVLEPPEIIEHLHSMLIDVSGVGTKALAPTCLTGLGCSTLIALSVARGEAEFILNAAASLIMSPPALASEYIQIPLNLTLLQRSVLAVILGPPFRNQWLNYGVPHQSLVISFPVDLPAQLIAGDGEVFVRSLVSDGCYLYVYTSKGLLKIGSGYGSSIRQHIYLYKPDFFPSDRHGWLGFCKGKFYARIGRKKTDIFEIDKDSLETKRIVRLDPGLPAPLEPKSAVFTDGHLLGLITLNDYDNLTIRMYDVENPETREETITVLEAKKELNVPLLRRRTLALGQAPFEDGLSRRNIDYDAPIAVQLDDLDEDPLVGIYSGLDFGLLTTASGKVYYTGKGPSLGYKQATPHPGRWTLMKETLFNRNEIGNSTDNVKRTKVLQAAVGHEGAHAVLVMDNGSALFVGISRRGEDGDPNKHHRRTTPKPTRPKRIFKAEGHHIIYAACNYGSTALVTRQGLLLMFGKDTQHCDATGLVIGLRHERVKQVSLGKAHAVALTFTGLVYTFGINNKGQCGREFGYTKEKSYMHRRQSSHNREEVRICPNGHTWTTVYCRECTAITSCACASHPNSIPGEKCMCGEGDSGCSSCGICRRCADTFTAATRAEHANNHPVTDLDDEVEVSSLDSRTNIRYANYETQNNGSEGDRDSSMKVSCLPPARVAVPGGHRVVSIACGLHHTVLLTESEVLTFGSNQFGQLGAGDIAPHHRIVRVRVPKAVGVAAGSNHTAVLTKDGELYTFGSYLKGALGRPRLEEPQHNDRGPIWYATPGRVPRIGLRNACKAVWVSANGDQTFVQVSQALINTDTLFSATITANNNCIVILPNRPEHKFKCITISKLDGSCTPWTGPEQVDFVHTLSVLDPLYDIFWCYQPQMRVMKCYNILAFDSHELQRCNNNHDLDMFSDGELEYPSHGNMKKVEDFKNLEDFEAVCSDVISQSNVALSSMSILNQELALPITSNSAVTRMHAALHLLGCLDSLTYAYDQRLQQQDCRKANCPTNLKQAKEDFLTVNRFEGHGGGWGYSGHSVEAIRFMCDTDILLGGIGLFGGRGDYSARAKLFDIGLEGGDLEADGELLAETDEIVYECAPRDKFPVLFDSPVHLLANRWYLAWACISGPSSDCGSSGQAMVIQDEIGFHFKTSKKSNNGTDVNAGQIPSLLYNVANPDHIVPTRAVDLSEPVTALSKNISRKVTVGCFKSLITLLSWSWKTFKDNGLDTNGQIPINYKKLIVMKHQKRMVYVIRACLRLVKFYINEICPQYKKRSSQEFISYVDAIGEVRNLIQSIMADPTPTCNNLPKKFGNNKARRVCYVQFAFELTNSILREAHETFVACFHAFFPTPSLKWKQICTLLFYVKGGVVPEPQIEELTGTCAGMCNSKSLQDVLNYVLPVTQGCMALLDKQRPETKIKEATIQRVTKLTKKK